LGKMSRIKVAGDENCDYYSSWAREITLANYDWQIGGRGALIAGVDEVGRGAIAGPIVAAAILVPAGLFIRGIGDSKQIPKRKHQELYDNITAVAFDYAFAAVSNLEIDQIGIQAANQKVLAQSVARLRLAPKFVLSDWFPIACTFGKNVPVKRGDETSMAIASASILAKFFRDRIMRAFHHAGMQGYGFITNAGYGTQEHFKAIKLLGMSPIHRRSFLTRDKSDE
jgi:ribonuclease HII